MLDACIMRCRADGYFDGYVCCCGFQVSAPACERLGVHRSPGLVERTVLWPMVLAYLGKEQGRTCACHRETDEKQYNDITNSKKIDMIEGSDAMLIYRAWLSTRTTPNASSRISDAARQIPEPVRAREDGTDDGVQVS